MKKFTTHQHVIQVQQNALVDEGDGVITFPGRLTITDDSEQRNGTRYDIPSMDISEYNGKLTADHSWSITEMLGKALDVVKGNNNVSVGGIKFAVKESALAKFTYNMMKAGYLTDFSIETYGPWPDEEGVYKNAKLVGLSVVVTGNNKSAEIKEIAKNSIIEAKELGLDTSIVEKEYTCYDNDQSDVDASNSSQKETQIMFVTVKNSKAFAVVLKYKNAAGEDVETTVQPGQSIDVSEEQKASVESQIDSAKDVKAEENKLAEMVQNAMKPVMDKIAAIENKAFDSSAQEPKFTKVKAASTSELAKMNWRELHGVQINKAWDMLKSNNGTAARELETINQYNLEKLQEKDIVANSITLADMGNFVISPELLSEIEGFRSDFQPLLSKLTFRETLSLQMAWLKRSGDINMQEVEMCDDGADGNLKPISEYSASIEQSNLHELAAVTPVCNSATRFLAADLLTDVAAGYRNDFDRKRAQLFIARLQQAVNATGNVTTYATTTDTDAVKSFITAWSEMAEEVPNGTFIFNYRTYGELLRRLVGAGISTDTAMGIFTTGDQSMILGRPYIVVPNELLPDLNTAQTKSFTVEGVSVTINRAVFYADLTQFSGRTSGGLMYDLSTEAAYEDGSAVKSAFQRNELVLRGSFFRGGAIRDEDRVMAMGAPGVS